MALLDKLIEQTADFKAGFMTRTSEWLDLEIPRLIELSIKYTNSQSYVNAEYVSYAKADNLRQLGICMRNHKPAQEQFKQEQLRLASENFDSKLSKLAFRIMKKNLNKSELKIESSYLDPNFACTITDGSKTVTAFTIIASGCVQAPHYRYLIK